MSNLKTKKKSLTEIEQTKPAQLELFKIDDQNSENMKIISNAKSKNVLITAGFSKLKMLIPYCQHLISVWFFRNIITL